MRSLILLLLVIASTSLHAERVDQSLKVDPNGTVRIDVIAGDVSVIGWDKPEVRVVGDIPNSKEHFVFTSDGDDTRIEVESKHGFWGGKNGGSASIKVYCPANSTIRSDGASTSFRIQGVRGSIDVSTMSGNIDLEGGDGKVELESVSGDVTVNEAKGKLNLASVSGDVIADVIASFFEAQTVSGDITARIGTSEQVELESVSGDIDLKFSLVNDGRLDADTVSGDIDIRFDSDNINATFDLETGPGGDIRNRITNDKSSSVFSLSGSLEFQMGNGDASVNLETMSGTINLEK